MINLLPPLEKKRILWKKREKKILSVWILALLFLVFLGMGMFSINIYLAEKTSALKKEIRSKEGFLGQSQMAEVRQNISKTNKILNKLELFYREKIYFFDIFVDISQVMPKEIYLSSLSAVPDREEGAVKVSLSGFSPTRDDLFVLKTNIESKTEFQNVSFPPSNWVKPADIDFFANFEIPL